MKDYKKKHRMLQAGHSAELCAWDLDRLWRGKRQYAVLSYCSESLSCFVSLEWWHLGEMTTVYSIVLLCSVVQFGVLHFSVVLGSVT